MTKFIRKKTCYIGKNVKFGNNVVVYENNHLEGDVYIGDDTVLLPGNLIINSKIGDNCTISNSVIQSSRICNNVSVGPFARIRPNSIIEDNAKVGNFVELKNCTLGSGSKMSHLAYAGDCEIGKNCNIGCGVIFANYNGKNKNKTRIGDHVFIGSNCNIIAPVVIEDDSYICAGTTVSENVAKGDFVIGRVRQENKPDKAKNYW